MDRYTVMEGLSPGQYCKVTRIDTTTGIFACPTLLYASDGEEEDNLPNAQDAVEDPGPVEPSQSLESIDPPFEQGAADQVRRITTLCDRGNPLLKDEDVDLPEKLSNVDCIEFLVKKGPTIQEWIESYAKKGPTILTARKTREQSSCSRILRKLGGEIKVLPPGNNADDLGDWTDRSRWAKYLSALVSEMLTVEDGCSSEVRDSGVFVLTTFQYPALLEMMAQELLTGH